MIFTSDVSISVLEQLENLTPVYKCVENEFPSVSCLNYLESLSFVICFNTKSVPLSKT